MHVVVTLNFKLRLNVQSCWLRLWLTGSVLEDSNLLKINFTQDHLLLSFNSEIHTENSTLKDIIQPETLYFPVFKNLLISSMG